jgi:chitinase
VLPISRPILHRAYDYAGSWSAFTDNQANLYGPSLSGYGSDGAIAWYIAQGATPAKINLGVPLYGRAFEQTKGIGHAYNGVISFEQAVSGQHL